MNHPLSICGLAGIMFIGPNSEALLSNTTSFDMNNAGYHCTSGQAYRQINITYQDHHLYTQSCNVSYQKNAGANKTLWGNQRNAANCEAKAELIAQRLEDRGWQCQTAGI
jgi:hypothetical protein